MIWQINNYSPVVEHACTFSTCNYIEFFFLAPSVREDEPAVLFSAATGTRGCAETPAIGAGAWGAVKSLDSCLVESWWPGTVLPSTTTVEPLMMSGKFIGVLGGVAGVTGGVASPTCEEGKGLSKLNRSWTRNWLNNLMNAGSLKQSVYLGFL